MRYFIIGLPGVGKTHFGKRLADALGADHLDLDQLIEEDTGSTISNLFDKQGEDHFRAIESDLLRKVTKYKNTVISVGGGTPCFGSNLDLMLASGTCLYLVDDLDTISDRISVDLAKRPMFRNKSKTEILQILSDLNHKRRPHYEQTHVITGLDAINTPHLLTNRLELFTNQ